MALARPRDPLIRRAVDADGEALGRLIEEPVIALGGKPRNGEGIALVELGDPDVDTLVAEGREGLQGFLQLRWGRRPPANYWMQGSAELRRHYVRHRHRGTGVASRLLEGALGAARARQAGCIWLKLDKDSPQLVRFYQAHGFQLAGTTLFVDAGRARPHWVMHRVVTNRRAAAPTTAP